MIGAEEWDGGKRDDEVDETEELVADEEYVADEELELHDEDESLPWLEEAEDYQSDDVDSARVVWFVAAGLLALVAILGGIWWATNRGGPDQTMVADGGTIEAPEGPYKEKPEDPGGRQVEGTGAVAPAVAEGQRREGRIAEGSDARPSIDTEQSGAGQSASSQTGSGAQQASASAAPASGGVGVQVGAYSNIASAERGWNELTGRYSALSGFRYRIVEGQADIGKVYRLQAIAGSRAAANDLCNKLKSAGGACQVK